MNSTILPFAAKSPEPELNFDDYELVEEYNDNLFEEDDEDTQNLKHKRSILVACCIGSALIAFLIIVGSIIGAAILLNEPIDYILPTNATTTTTTTTTTIYRDPTFNETCITTCNATQGLACDTSGVCLCADATLHWSYATQTCISCRSGWFAYIDICWQYFPEPMGYDWTDAGTFCASQNSVLMSLENYNKFLYFQFVYYVYWFYMLNIQSECWINSTTTVPKTFAWYNGDPVNPAEWAPNQPDNNGGTPTFANEGCLAISSLDNFGLNDAPCSNLYDVFCEYYN